MGSRWHNFAVEIPEKDGLYWIWTKKGLEMDKFSISQWGKRYCGEVTSGWSNHGLTNDVLYWQKISKPNSPEDFRKRGRK